MSCNDINFNAGFSGCNDKIAILKNEVVQRDLSNFKKLSKDEVDTSAFVYVNQDDESYKMSLSDVMTGVPIDEIQADWDQEDNTKYDFIKNKPELRLTEDLVSLYNIGGVKIGQVFPAGTDIIDIVKEILSSDSPEEFYYGVIDSLAPDIVNEMIEVQMPISELISKGFQTPQLTLNNQYYALAIPKSSSIEVKAIYQGGYSLGFKVIDLDQAWDLIVDANEVRTTGTYTFDYRFKQK